MRGFDILRSLAFTSDPHRMEKTKYQTTPPPTAPRGTESVSGTNVYLNLSFPDTDRHILVPPPGSSAVLFVWYCLEMSKPSIHRSIADGRCWGKSLACATVPDIRWQVLAFWYQLAPLTPLLIFGAACLLVMRRGFSSSAIVQ